MSRELRRVPLDFEWPMNKIWTGYLVPDALLSIPCGHCHGAGVVGDRREDGARDECVRCGGEGKGWRSDEHKAAAEAWEPSDPQEGPGYQMWETTSEGSPISPVFATPEELAMWLTDTKASAFGGCTANYDHWLRMINGTGYAPSAIISGGRLMSGVEGLALTSMEDSAQ